MLSCCVAVKPQKCFVDQKKHFNQLSISMSESEEGLHSYFKVNSPFKCRVLEQSVFNSLNVCTPVFRKLPDLILV